MNRLVRVVPLAGVVYALLAVIGNGTIGKFPDSDTPTAKLATFYAIHHAGVERGGVILAWSGLFLAIFAVALWARIRRSEAHPSLGGLALLGAAISSAAAFDGGGVYALLGSIGSKPTLAPAALQALHANGAGGSALTGDGGLALLLLAVAAAGIAARAFPRWIAWSALPLALLQLTPLGFFAGLIFWVWAIVAAIYLTIRPEPAPAWSDSAYAASPGMTSPVS